MFASEKILYVYIVKLNLFLLEGLDTLYKMSCLYLSQGYYHILSIYYGLAYYFV